MGGLTYIKHAGRELQSYLDRLGETYEIGSKIPWKALFTRPGETKNGYDEAWWYEGNIEHPYILVIKDLTLVDIVEVPFKDGHADRETGYKLAREKHGTEFETPPRDLWPELAWECLAWSRQQYQEREARELAVRLEEIKANWKPPAEGDVARDPLGCPYTLLGEQPKTLEEALAVAEMSYHASSFTRQMLRQPGFMRQIVNVWDELPELTANVRDEILAEFVPQIGWRYGDEMLAGAAKYRAERLLKERGLWPTNHIEYPVGVRVKVIDGTLEISVKQMTDKSEIPPPRPDEKLRSADDLTFRKLLGT